MQRYQCHKIVEAAKIASIIGATVRLAGDDPADVGEIKSVSKEWLSRFKPKVPNDLGYFVRYEDGYESWSPTQAFEAGYTLILPGDVDTVVERDGTVRGAPLPDLGDLRR
jgi:hypothetical protein